MSLFLTESLRHSISFFSVKRYKTNATAQRTVQIETYTVQTLRSKPFDRRGRKTRSKITEGRFPKIARTLVICMDTVRNIQDPRPPTPLPRVQRFQFIAQMVSN